MLDYFLSSDWAIIATELLAGFFVITLVLAVLVWRGQRRHTGAAEELLDDREPILRATEEMVERQIKRLWPEMTLDEEQRQTYAERCLDAVEAMVEPWLEPKRSDLSSVARQFQRVRQEDLEQLLTLARAHAEASQADDERVAELEQELKELREQRDRQAKHLNESLETVNVMVREYGRKFDYNEEPRVASILKAIVMVEEMAAGADCETAQQRAENIFTEDLVASPGAAPEEAEPEPTEATTTPGEEETTAEIGKSDAEEAAPDAAEQMAAAMEMEAAASRESDTIDVGGEETGQSDTTEIPTGDEREAEPDEDTEMATPQRPPSTDAEPPAEDAGDEEDIDALIAQAQASTETASTSATAHDTAPDEAEPAAEQATEEETTEKPPVAESDKEPVTDEAEEPSEPETTDTTDDRRKEDAEDNGEPENRREEDTEDNGVIDLDDVEIPEEDQEKAESDADEFDLDDIDALLDAEIAKKHGKSQD